MPEQNSFEHSSSESLSEKDRALNELARKFEAAARALEVSQYTMIQMADSEIPQEHAKVNTDALARVKRYLQVLNQPVLEIERTEKIIDVQPWRNLLEGEQ